MLTKQVKNFSVTYYGKLPCTQLRFNDDSSITVSERTTVMLSNETYVPIVDVMVGDVVATRLNEKIENKRTRTKLVVTEVNDMPIPISVWYTNSTHPFMLHNGVMVKAHRFSNDATH